MAPLKTILKEDRLTLTREVSGVATMPEVRPGPGEQPAWIAAELPPEYGEIARKIDALRQEARYYERLADILWCEGEPLKEAVRAVFDALEFKSVLPDASATYDLAIELEPQKRLLVQVVAGVSPFDKRSPEIVRALRVIQEEAGAGDRVVFVANIPCDKPTAMRQEVPATPDALRLIQGLGANLIATSTLFGLWRYSLQDRAAARKSIHLLHALDGGIFR
jgi:hypothetical protein